MLYLFALYMKSQQRICHLKMPRMQSRDERTIKAKIADSFLICQPLMQDHRQDFNINRFYSFLYQCKLNSIKFNTECC